MFRKRGLTALLMLPTVAQAAPPRAFGLDDLPSIVALHDAQISPDGRSIAVLIARPDVKTDKPREEVDLVDVATGAVRAFTSQRNGLGEPRWSPDGSRLAFLAEAPPEAPDTPSADADEASRQQPAPEVFVARLDGGDPVKVTSAKAGVLGFSWSPDGASIAFVTPDEAPNAAAVKAHDGAFEVTDGNFLARKPEPSSHLWLAPAAGGPARRLTSGPMSLAHDQTRAPVEPAFTPDGQAIVFGLYPEPWFGTSHRSVIGQAPAAGGATTVLADAPGAQDPRIAPASGAVAFVRPRGGDQNNGDAVYVRLDGRTFDATAALARNISAYAWMPDGRSLLLEGADGVATALWLAPPDGPARRLDLGEAQPTGHLSVSRSGVIAFTALTPGHPAEVYVQQTATSPPRRLTHFNDFVDGLALGRRTGLTWRSRDGFEENGVVTWPADVQPGEKRRLALVIHGGPAAASTTGFEPLPYLLAAKGFVVFEPNYRGSTGSGDAFEHAIFRDTGRGPGEDVMAGIAALERGGGVDPQRVAVSGWSYGGYMTAWLTGHYGIWKAAVAGAPLTDWVLDYTIAFYQRQDAYYLGNSPWTGAGFRIWRDQSPIAAVRNVKAPTLVLGDVGDPNVPLINAYEWHHALRDNGVETQFVAYPAETHFPSDIVQTMDVYRRWIDWLDTHDR